MKVKITISEQSGADYTFTDDLAAFLVANEDGIDATEPEIVAAIDADGEWFCGGGAAPVVTVRAV